MGYPDLKSDESIVLTAQHVKVKSVPFELVLTNRRLIIIDSEKNVVPTQQITLFSIRNVMASENAIRDPVITLTIQTDAAETREMALTFVRQSAGERRREADEWAKSLRKYISEAASQPGDFATGAPAAFESRPDHGVTPGIKKKIEIAGPIKRITVDTSHLPPKPVESTSLPEGSFCGRCGNRIPPGSTFCNRCGTRVNVPSEEVPAPVAAPQIATAPAATAGAGERKISGGRPIEQIIHSIEPLIEDSVPRTGSSPAVPEPFVPAPATREAESSVPAPETPAPAQESVVPSEGIAPAATAAPAPAEGEQIPAAAIPPAPPIPPVPAAPRKGGRKILAAAIIVILVIAVVAGGLFVLPALNKSAVVTPTPTPTPVPTTATPTPTPTPVPTSVVTTVAVTTTPQSLVPQSGVWAEVTYDNTYSGQVGVPGSQASVSDTGDHFYRIPTVDGIVAITLKKTDGSGDELKVVLYKDGAVVTTASTKAPYGTVDMQFSLPAASTPTPTVAILTATPTATLTGSNATANKTASSS
jgi:hypothetical protein